MPKNKVRKSSGKDPGDDGERRGAPKRHTSGHLPSRSKRNKGSRMRKLETGARYLSQLAVFTVYVS